MHLILSQQTVANSTYWLGSTTRGLAFVGSPNGPQTEWQSFFKGATTTLSPTANTQAAAELTDYLTGKRTTFDLPLDQAAGTDLQRQVWSALLTIPYGQTVSYTDLARQIKRPKATRAVASAVGRNPLLIVVPCHRVIRQDGSLGGYRGGLPMKRQLLALESQK